MNQTNQANPSILEGYRQNAEGHLIPESVIKPIDKVRDELVLELAQKAREMSEAMRQMKAYFFAQIYAFIELSLEEYGVAHGGKKGNVTLFSFDAKYKVQIAIAERMIFDERLQAAKALIDACIKEWSADSRDEIKVLVLSAFQTDKEGKINTGRVLGLRRLDIADPRWANAMQAIGESLQVIGSKEYVRFYERIDGGETYQPISLDMAGV